jgi:DNA-binding NarL/FixJ family response regulator
MRVNLVGLCLICTGKGTFLSKKCSECNGKGGKIISCSQEAKERFEQKRNVLSEQEISLFENYSQGLSQDEIATSMDLPLNKVVNILYVIEQKLNK